MIQSLNTLFEKNLDKLSTEISSYKSDEALWKTDKEILNSGGNLCLHLCGNLQHYIGTVLGNTGYQRDRPAEFSDKNIAKEDLLELIEATREAITETLNSLDPEALSYEYPEIVFKKPMSKEYFLIHLVTHLGYHLGQINYHRRLLDT
jgi:uncharacterized damage-inducible protein DinB